MGAKTVTADEFAKLRPSASGVAVRSGGYNAGANNSGVNNSGRCIFTSSRIPASAATIT